MLKIEIRPLYFFLICVLFCVQNPVLASDWWAGATTNITIGEFIDNYFFDRMGREINDGNKLHNYIGFLPSSSPHVAFIFMVQPWSDEMFSDQNLRREIRKESDYLYKKFNSLARQPIIKNRWNFGVPNKNFILKHVRVSDFDEVIAVTVDDKTYFEDEEIKKIELLVKQRGGFWTF